MHRCLCDPVHIDQLRRLTSISPKPRFQTLQFQRFSSKDYPTQASFSCILRPLIHSHQLSECRRRLIQYCDTLPYHQLMKVFRRPADQVWHYHQSPAAQQRSKYLPYRKVKRIGVEKRPHICLAEIEFSPSCCKQPHEITVTDQCPFWLPCRS